MIKVKQNRSGVIEGVATPSSSRVLMEAALHDLGYSGQVGLYGSTDQPVDLKAEDWLDKGEWLSLALEVGAEQVFFVDNNPIVVFAQHGEPVSDDETLRVLFNRIWCMSRPRLLFLARDGELAVYDLGQEPVAHGEGFEKQLLATARTAAEVSSGLARFRREQIEEGRLFADKDLKGRNRADEALIRHLKLLRQQLTGGALGEGIIALKVEHAHALIGRSIFVRYLEDRGILVREDFEELAKGHEDWVALLDQPWDAPPLEPGMADKLYLKVLQNKEFTYALFEYLAQTFHGDIFPSDDEEREKVTPQHLDLLQRFLSGQIQEGSLFLWAYDFSIVPIELISSIYEEFYHEEVRVPPKGEPKNSAREKAKASDAGSHYTPAALVEWVLSQTLTPDVLAGLPRVLDPAAGSGIFLVEAFRRMVRFRRFQAAHHGGEVSREEMLEILRNQIAGIELNPHAARVAAFSLYLAFLHPQNPPAIRQHPRLPHLLYDEHRAHTEYDYDVLLAANSFDVGSSVSDPDVRRRFESQCVEVVVGNPPWGQSGQGGKEVAAVAKRWCEERDLPVGDNEPSQQFLHLAGDLLRPDGRCGFLVSGGVLLKQKGTSQAFRRNWLQNATLHQVTNFTHVRHVFFNGAVSPFISVVWSKGRSTEENLVRYWSAKKTALVDENEIVVLSRADLRVVPQSDLMADGRLWKVYWWAGHRDAALLSTLRLNPPLESYQELWAGEPGTGFKESDGRMRKQPSWAGNFQELPVKDFHRYGTVNPRWLRNPPELLARPRQERFFEGLRLLVKGAPSRDNERFYEIVARIETQPYCVRHSIYSFPIQDTPVNRELAKVVVGTLWSSLASYYLFLSDSTFGTWHDRPTLDAYARFPLPLLKTDAALKQRLVSLVDQLHKTTGERNLFEDGETGRRELERQLDDAVFDLYELSAGERDLVRDMCEVGFDLLSNGPSSAALQPLAERGDKSRSGFVNNLDAGAGRDDLDGYLKAFVTFWSAQLRPSGDDIMVGWQILNSPEGSKENPLLGVRFGLCYPEEQQNWSDQPSPAWDEVLESFASSNRVPLGSRGVEVEGLVRLVSESDILIIKRNERRLWTPSAAREDVEAALLQVWRHQEHSQNSNMEVRA